MRWMVLARNALIYNDENPAHVHFPMLDSMNFLSARHLTAGSLSSEFVCCSPAAKAKTLLGNRNKANLTKCLKFASRLKPNWELFYSGWRIFSEKGNLLSKVDVLPTTHSFRLSLSLSLSFLSSFIVFHFFSNSLSCAGILFFPTFLFKWFASLCFFCIPSLWTNTAPVFLK